MIRKVSRRSACGLCERSVPLKVQPDFGHDGEHLQENRRQDRQLGDSAAAFVAYKTQQFFNCSSHFQFLANDKEQE